MAGKNDTDSSPSEEVIVKTSSDSLRNRLKGASEISSASVPPLPRRVRSIPVASSDTASLPVKPNPIPVLQKSSNDPRDAEVGTAKLDDVVSDAIVEELAATQDQDEIMSAKESESTVKKSKKQPSKNKFVRIIKRKLTWLIVILLAIIVIFALPVSRYKILGLFIKNSYTITVNDSKTDTPVSYANIEFAGHLYKTDAAGKVTLKVPVGYGSLSITKQYYEGYQKRIAIGLSKQSTALHVTLLATGRQVPIMVHNELTGQVVADATIVILNTTAKTNSSGEATIVLPTKAKTYAVTVSASGYNNTISTVTVTSSILASNNFKLTPAGKLYFLSNASGKINIASINLDGSDPQVVLPGTGNETIGSTALYSSSNGQYLMLIAQRTATPGTSGLYLINPGDNNALTAVDQGAYTYTPIGWSGDYFVYEVENPSAVAYQPGQYILKSYDADTGHVITLDQTNATGTASDYASQTIDNTYLVNGKLLYTKVWSGSDDYYAANNYTSSINTINVNGLSQSPLQQFPMTSNDQSNINYLSAAMYASGQIYYEANYNDGSQQFYGYDDGNVTTATVSAASFNAVDYNPGVPSPSGTSAAFSTSRNGQFVLLTGAPDSTSSSQHTIATLSNDYSFYSWYGDSYIILSYKSEDLEIMPASGLATGQLPIKITTYLNEPNDNQ
jgi:hypothetical protein